MGYKLLNVTPQQVIALRAASNDSVRWQLRSASGSPSVLAIIQDNGSRIAVRGYSGERIARRYQGELPTIDLARAIEVVSEGTSGTDYCRIAVDPPTEVQPSITTETFAPNFAVPFPDPPPTTIPPPITIPPLATLPPLAVIPPPTVAEPSSLEVETDTGMKGLDFNFRSMEVGAGDYRVTFEEVIAMYERAREVKGGRSMPTSMIRINDVTPAIRSVLIAADTRDGYYWGASANQTDNTILVLYRGGVSGYLNDDSYQSSVMRELYITYDERVNMEVVDVATAIERLSGGLVSSQELIVSGGNFRAQFFRNGDVRMGCTRVRYDVLRAVYTRTQRRR